MDDPRPLLKLRVTAAAQSAIRRGHPWVFADAVLDQSRVGELGETTVVYDRNDRFLGIGLLDPQAPIRLRMLHVGKPLRLDASWWASRLESAIQRRRDLLEDPSTDGLRLVYGESDGWPGFVLDKYADTLVVKLYTAAWLPKLQERVQLLQARLAPERIILRLSRNIQETARNSFARLDGDLLFGSLPEGPILFRESGLAFEADVVRGQKTGFFLDQRENRRRLETQAGGRRVLNTFSFSGGFSVYAARGGARQVTDVDISAHALEGGGRNYRLNQGIPAVRDCPRITAKADVFDWLEETSERYDAAVLDPPSLARKQSEKGGAIQAYGRLAELGIARLSPGGILAACSCSAHVSAEEFYQVVRNALRRSGRNWREIETCGHPLDHAATFKEAEYLKAIWVEVG